MTGKPTHKESERIKGLEKKGAKRKPARKALREFREFKEKIISESPIGMSIYDASGQCVAANDSIGELIGATKAQVLEQNYNNIESWKKSGMLDRAKSAARENSKKRHELKVRSTFGKDVSLDCHLVPFSSEGETHLLLMINDISERIQAEEALQQAHDELERRVEERTAELVKANKELQAEIIQRKQVENALLEKTHRLNIAYEQATTYAQELNEEVTERKQADDALRESEAKYSTLVENSLTGIFIHQDGKYVFMNDRFANIHGYQPEELLGQDPLTLIHPGEREALRKVLSKRLKGESAPKRYEVRRLRKDGKTIWCEMMAARIEYAGRPAIMGNVIDITERKRVQEALREAHKELEQRIKDRTAELASRNEELLEYDHIVAHVLKAPLRAIHYYSDFLWEELEGTLKGNQKTHLDGLTRTVRQAAGLVDDLLDFSTVGRRSGPIETIDIGVFLQELIVSIDLPSDVEVVMGNEWPSIEAEPALLQAIFSHLIRNAVKFNRLPHKRVELGWLPENNERYELFVRDNGIGIEPRHQLKIFHMFERLHTHEEYEGTGVGLAIVKKATNRLGGSVRVESRPGKGTTFFIVLPKTRREK